MNAEIIDGSNKERQKRKIERKRGRKNGHVNPMFIVRVRQITYYSFRKASC